MALIFGLTSATAAAIVGAGSFYLFCELTVANEPGILGSVCAPHDGAVMLIVLAPIAVVWAWSSARSSGKVKRFQITVGLLVFSCLLVFVVTQTIDGFGI